MAEPKMTLATQFVLGSLLADPSAERYGGEIAELAGLATGTVHPILARLEGVSWVESRWEDVDPSAVNRPARRYYRLTGAGVVSAQAALAKASRARRSRLAPRPAWEQS